MDSTILLGPFQDDCEEDCDPDTAGEPKAGGMESSGADTTDTKE